MKTTYRKGIVKLIAGQKDSYISLKHPHNDTCFPGRHAIRRNDKTFCTRKGSDVGIKQPHNNTKKLISTHDTHVSQRGTRTSHPHATRWQLCFPSKVLNAFYLLVAATFYNLYDLPFAPSTVILIQWLWIFRLVLLLAFWEQHFKGCFLFIPWSVITINTIITKNNWHSYKQNNKKEHHASKSIKREKLEMRMSFNIIQHTKNKLWQWAKQKQSS